MRVYRLNRFGLEHLQIEEASAPRPGRGEVLVQVQALSLNFRDLMVVNGLYNPRLALPATPVSDGAGLVAAVGEGVTRWKVGDRVVSHFVASWIDGVFSADYPKSSLGTPGPGLAAEYAALPAEALVAIPTGLDFGQAATLPIAALTAWSVLVSEGRLDPRKPAANAGKTVLTLGTGGVSIFALQLAKALGARVVITSSRDEKLRRAAAMGADLCVNYRTTPDWDKTVVEFTRGGADITVETGGAGTLDASMRATRAGGLVGVLGALTGLKAEVSTALILMKRLHLAGIYVDCRRAFEEMNAFIQSVKLLPVIDRTYSFAELPAALGAMQRGEHFGKLVVNVVG
ncbi:alcohol dehydrogenase [Phycisphaerae bacterium RAS1]|nr:alcohol dehydrogenase [Phycisphaerae bacterium RAS1]